MFNFLKKIYTNCPDSFKSITYLIPYNIIAGKNYRKTIDECSKLYNLSNDEINSFKEKKLRETLNFAVNQVPFYHKYKYAVEKYSAFDAIKEFPILKKDDVKKNLDSLTPKSLHHIPHHSGTTGGTSGNQLFFLEDDTTYSKEMGFMHFQWNRVGYTPSSRKATFRGVKFSNIHSNIFWQKNPIHNEIQFSPFHMNEENLFFYIKKLEKYKPDFLHGYPSAISILSEFIIRHRFQPSFNNLKAILLGSEACSISQRAKIMNAFNKPIFTWYGQSERVILGGTCLHSNHYHSFPNYGYLEIIKNNEEYAEFGERGLIIGTGFLNKSLPLIRYNTEDTAIKYLNNCSCGSSWDLFGDVIGRWNLDYLYGKSGAKIYPAALNMHGELFKNVIRYQYIQKQKGKLLIQLIPNINFSVNDIKIIINEHNQKLWGEMSVDIEIVNEIQLSLSGKEKKVINYLNYT